MHNANERIENAAASAAEAMRRRLAYDAHHALTMLADGLAKTNDPRNAGILRDIRRACDAHSHKIDVVSLDALERVLAAHGATLTLHHRDDGMTDVALDVRYDDATPTRVIERLT